MSVAVPRRQARPMSKSRLGSKILKKIRMPRARTGSLGSAPRLQRKYGSTEQLRKSWNAEAAPAGPELLRNGNFGSALESHWNSERDDVAQAD